MEKVIFESFEDRGSLKVQKEAEGLTVAHEHGNEVEGFFIFFDDQEIAERDARALKRHEAQELVDLEAEMPQMLSDFVDLLISKNVIKASDLPKKLKGKFSRHKKLKAKK